MQVALISEQASPLATLNGGIASGSRHLYLAQVARQLARHGHAVDVFTRRDAPGLPAVVPFAANARVIHLAAGPAVRLSREELPPHREEFARRLLDYCGPPRARYDVAHATSFAAGLAALALKEAYGTPLVLTFHTLGKAALRQRHAADAGAGERIAIEERLVAQADRLVAVCPQERADLIALYGADPARVDMAAYGFDPEELGPGPSPLRERYGLSPSDFVILHLGRLLPTQGIDNIIRALAELRQRHGIEARLLVVGSEADEALAAFAPALTPEIGRLIGVARSVGVADRVMFAGRRPRSMLRDFYCAADVFVTTPGHAPSGVTSLEAMACGCPVVGSKVGGIQYTVIDSVTGYLVPPDDPVQLAERLARLRHNPALARAFGRAGILRVRAAFTWKRVTAQLARSYAAVQPAARGSRRSERRAAKL